MLYATFTSIYDYFTIIWKEDNSNVQIQRVFLSDQKVKSEAKTLESFGQIKQGSSLVIDNLGKNIQQFLKGIEVKFLAQN